jgi:hypothetical protein
LCVDIQKFNKNGKLNQLLLQCDKNASNKLYYIFIELLLQCYVSREQI